MPNKPQTPAEWRVHAEDLHGRGLEMADKVNGMRNVPTEVAHVNALHAQTFFLAAQSAIAMAGYLASPDSTP